MDYVICPEKQRREEWKMDKNNVFDSLMEFFGLTWMKINEDRQTNSFQIADRFLDNCETLDDVIEVHMDALKIILEGTFRERYCHHTGERITNSIVSGKAVEELKCYICHFMKPFWTKKKTDSWKDVDFNFPVGGKLMWYLDLFKLFYIPKEIKIVNEPEK